MRKVEGDSGTEINSLWEDAGGPFARAVDQKRERKMGRRITVLGGGNTAFSLAAQLALQGDEILLWEHPDFAWTLEPLRTTLTIHLEGAGNNGAARLSAVTTNAAEALGWSEMLLCSVPSYAHAPFITELVPHLRPGHVITLLPGNFGALAFAAALRDVGVAGVIVAESDTAPFVCRKVAPDRATIWGVVSNLGLGVFPASQTAEVLPELQSIFPGASGYRNVLETGLSAMNPVVHPAGVLMNAGRIERSRGEFYFYDEGVTPSVVRAIEAVDSERLAIGRAYGLELTPVAAAFHSAGFGPAGDLWAVINGSKMLTALRAPGQINTRWLTEDIPFGLCTWSNLGAAVSVPTPTIDALIVLSSVVLDIDLRQQSRSLLHLGIAGFDRQQVAMLLDSGNS